ncbi:hypothetical protein MLD38_015087 [Melastoma candidum]|uniref:Uncharacterized protein n=1 Tax=Melastoma candidum TaxID=119954 RepID=A0ACB9RG45_9MYRT|nr:hypothetical protein MLD38_015087 [Melastoma candidum]
MDNLTASEVAGFGVGTLLACATIAAPRIDSFISSSQRSSLGMCKRCGDLRLIACTNCRGVGSVKAEGLIRTGVLVDLYETMFGEDLGGKTVACSRCRGRGNFPCRDCHDRQ